MWLDKALVWSPAQAIFHWRARRQLTVLAYHGINDPDCFEQHLDYLVKTTQPVTLDNVLGAIMGRSGLPKRAVLITFDDGDRSIIDVALPMLRNRGLPGVAFVVAGLLDTDQPFWWVEVVKLVENGGAVNGLKGLSSEEIVRALKKIPDQERLAIIDQLRRVTPDTVQGTFQLRRRELLVLESAGITIGNHTLTHPCLPRCTDDKLKTELIQAHELLAVALGQAPRAFAYPNGNADNRAVKILATLGYEAAFLFDHSQNPMPPSDTFRISRVRVNSNTPLDRFKIIISGLHPALHRIRGGV